MSQAAEKTIRILHVEDDRAHAALVRYGFAGHPRTHEIHHVETGGEALDYLLQRGDYADPASSPRPDVVLLDLRLPGIDGLEVLREIRASPELAELPVVILTTSEADRDRVDAYESLISAYVVKPFEFEGFPAILDLIDRVLKRPLERS